MYAHSPSIGDEEDFKGGAAVNLNSLSRGWVENIIFLHTYEERDPSLVALLGAH